MLSGRAARCLGSTLVIIVPVSLMFCVPASTAFAQTTHWPVMTLLERQTISKKPSRLPLIRDFQMSRQPRDYWIWGSMGTGRRLEHASTLYILQGEVNPSRHRAPQLVHKGMAPRLLPHQVWLVYRLADLQVTAADRHHMFQQLQRWRNQGTQVMGIQLDFDSGTAQLQGYAQFLQQFRAQLPASYQLSITGLLDWVNVAPADPSHRLLILQALHNSIDEIVIQTYQGRHTIPNYQLYLSKVNGLGIPFKIGVIEQDQDLMLPIHIEQSRWYRGRVIFLLKAPASTLVPHK